MLSTIVLAIWSGAGLLWWMLAWCLVRFPGKRAAPVALEAAPLRMLSVFKPLPPLRLKGIEIVATGLESFVSQLDAQSEMLIGVHEADREPVTVLIDRLRGAYPAAQLKVIYRCGPDATANPKIAWQKVLACHAEGELWLWSDADIVAPPEFLRTARAEYSQSAAAMLTFPYVIGSVPRSPALLEALFVNAEFYPGVLLLRKLGPVDFGLGAAMLFQRDDFLRAIDWDELGASLADDFHLGQKLQPVEIGSITLTTMADSSTWDKAVLHDLRWARTISWNRPLGFFARILVMPSLGWLAYALFHPAQIFAWIGVLGMIQADIFFAAAICRRAGCRLSWDHLPGLEMWSLWRIVLWFLCWLPGGVVWSGKIWRGPMEYSPDISPERL